MTMTTAMERDDVSIFLYTGARAPSDIVNARIDTSITAITVGAFCDCVSLESVELHEGVMTVENDVFNGCCSLRRIVMPSDNVFDGRSFMLSVDSSKKSLEIQQWLDSVRSKIEHHTAERNKLLREAARINCCASIEEENDIPFLIQESNRSNESASTMNSSPCSHTKDKMDDSDPGTCYGEDIYEYFRSKEADSTVTPTATYMDDQPYINVSMRSILIDWLIEVHMKFKLEPATLYLNVNIVDRYLTKAKVKVKRSQLQLVGVTALFVASKYEDIYPPELKDMVYICDGAYTKSEASVLAMERQIVQTLEYKLTIPSAHMFLARYIEVDDANKSTVQLASYILDGTLLSYELLRYCPSKLASAAMLIARNALGMHPWSCALANCAQYCEADVVIVARAVLAEKASTASELTSVLKKYSRSVYGCVANTDIPNV